MRARTLICLAMALCLLLFSWPATGAGDKVRLAPEMRKHVPLYPGAEVMDNLDHERVSQLKLVKTSCEKVADWYVKAMRDRGWKVEMNLTGELSAKLVFTHKTGRPTLLMDIDYVPPQWTYVHLRLIN